MAALQTAAIGLAMPLPGDIGRGAMHRLEHRGIAPFRIDIGAGRDAETSRDRATQIGEDVAKEIRADDHIEGFRPQHHAGSHRIDQHRFGLDAGIVERHPGEGFVPERHGVLLGIALGDAGDLLARSRGRPARRRSG